MQIKILSSIQLKMSSCYWPPACKYFFFFLLLLCKQTITIFTKNKWNAKNKFRDLHVSIMYICCVSIQLLQFKVGIHCTAFVPFCSLDESMLAVESHMQFMMAHAYSSIQFGGYKHVWYFELILEHIRCVQNLIVYKRYYIWFKTCFVTI